MIYVDDNLCTGCGLCVDTCAPGALSVQGSTALIDEDLCTGCGRCIDVCITGAIISAEIVPTDLVPESPPSGALARYPRTQPIWAGASSRYPTAAGATVPTAAPPASQPAATSKLEVVERLLSGLFSVITYALDRKQSGSIGSTAVTARAAKSMATAGGRGGRGTGCSGGKRASGGAQGLRRGQGVGSGRGRNDRCRSQRRNRNT
jgi:NAD-dependent dihydropyrimidine dehydrogenase PreA subunit